MYVLIFIGRGAWLKRIEFDESVVRHLLDRVYFSQEWYIKFTLSTLESRSFDSSFQIFPPLDLFQLSISNHLPRVISIVLVSVDSREEGGGVTFHGRWQSSETDSKISFRQTTLDKLCNDLFNRLWTVGRQTVKFNYNLLYLLTRHNKPDSRVCFRPTSSRQTSSMNSHCFSSRFSIRERKIARPLRGKLLLRRYIIFHISILPLWSLYIFIHLKSSPCSFLVFKKKKKKE